MKKYEAIFHGALSAVYSGEQEAFGIYQKFRLIAGGEADPQDDRDDNWEYFNFSQGFPPRNKGEKASVEWIHTCGQPIACAFLYWERNKWAGELPQVGDYIYYRSVEQGFHRKTDIAQVSEILPESSLPNDAQLLFGMAAYGMAAPGANFNPQLTRIKTKPGRIVGEIFSVVPAEEHARLWEAAKKGDL